MTGPATKPHVRHGSAILYASDRRRVLDYYAKLGFKCDYGMGFVSMDGLEFIVHETAVTDKIVPNSAHGSEALDQYAMVAGVQQLFESFKVKGAEFRYELRTNAYNMMEFAIVDPEGYSLGFGEPAEQADEQ
jgi:hypothetical protein